MVIHSKWDKNDYLAQKLKLLKCHILCCIFVLWFSSSLSTLSWKKMCICENLLFHLFLFFIIQNENAIQCNTVVSK